MSLSDRHHQIYGPYVDIHKTLMGFDPNWVSDPNKDEELPFYEWSLEGPAGTSKTFSEGTIIEDLHLFYSRLRTLILRKTRVSMSDSFLQVFEDDVLGHGHPVIRGPQRENRRKYVWPNGSETILAGMDNPTRLFSTQYDLVIFVEAIEFTFDEYQSIYRAMRNNGVPWKAIITDTNPGEKFHWLNHHPDDPETRMKRILTRHHHNPAYWDAKNKRWTSRGRQYRENLDQLRGVLRKRLRDGVWCSAEGAIWENFDPEIHVVEPGEVTTKKPDGENLPDFEYFIGGIDWGWNDCKVLQIWGVTNERHAYRVYEQYGTHITMETFIGWLKDVKKRYGRRGLVRIVADHSPEHINLCNESLGWRGKQSVGNMVQSARKGAKSVKAGNDLVRELWGDAENNVRPKAYLVKGALQEADRELIEKNRPTCTEQEIPSYVFKPQIEGKETVEIPDPGCVDHGCHTARYTLWEIWKSDFSKAKGRIVYGKNTLGAQLGHNEFIKGMSDKEYEKYIEDHDL